eukprot:jgi/Mesen1/3751/ME000205S03013
MVESTSPLPGFKKRKHSNLQDGHKCLAVEEGHNCCKKSFKTTSVEREGILLLSDQPTVGFLELGNEHSPVSGGVMKRKADLDNITKWEHEADKTSDCLSNGDSYCDEYLTAGFLRSTTPSFGERKTFTRPSAFTSDSDSEDSSTVGESPQDCFQYNEQSSFSGREVEHEHRKLKLPIPFHKIWHGAKEMQYVAESLTSGRIAGDGPFTKRAQHILKESLGGESEVLLTTSCTDALEMCSLLLDIQPGDEVIVPSFTFVSSINAFVTHGAKPVFVDVREDTLNIDEALIEQAITSRTKAVVIVHYGGRACAMDEIVAITERHGLVLIEDNAHSLSGRHAGRPLGTFGALATLSFHETKNLTCGEGGALIVNDPRLAERAAVLRSCGTDRALFLAGLRDKYTWVDKGSSFYPSDMLAALLVSQLEEQAVIQQRRQAVWHGYQSELQAWASREGVHLAPAHWSSGDVHAYHIFHMLLPSVASRVALAAHLKERHVATAVHYQPLHLAPMGVQLGGQQGQCPVAEDVSTRLLRLPLFPDMTEADVSYICQVVTKFRVAGTA